MQHNPNRRLTIVSADAFLPPNPSTQPPTSTRRKSIYAIDPDRYSTPVSRFSPDNITKYDVDCAFEILSKDGKKITKDDIFLFIERFFPSAPNKLPKLAISSLTTREATPQSNEEGIESRAATAKEDIGKLSREPLYSLLCKKSESKASAFEELFQLFDVVDGQIPREALKKYIRLLNPWGMIQKGDIDVLVKFMDVDGDGIISANDFLESRIKNVDIKHKF